VKASLDGSRHGLPGCGGKRHRLSERSVTMQIVVNGQERTLGAPITVAVLLQEMGMGGQRVAVEVNQEIVPR
jgi:hypothetical protein